MNKDQLIKVYYQNQHLAPKILELSEQYAELLSEEAIAPEFISFLQKSSDLKKLNNPSQDSTSIADSLSFCSNFSRITMDRFIYSDILNKRKEHKIFIIVENADSLNEALWYYVDDKSGNISGPYTPSEMTSRFELKILNEKTMIKKKFEESYIPLAVIVRRYFKNHLSQKLEIQKPAASLPANVTKFKRGEMPKLPVKRRENYEQRNRESRVFSATVKPSLLELKNLLPGDYDFGEFEPTRERAQTYTLRTC
jgi:hypothetical protein